MPNIILSEGIRFSVPNWMMKDSASSYLRICKGTPPANEQEVSLLTTGSGGRLSDVLIQYSDWNHIGSNAYGTQFVNATESGTATWFYITSLNLGIISGTVGTTNAADLVIGSTAIQQGLSYRVTNFTISLPEIISY